MSIRMSHALQMAIAPGVYEKARKTLTVLSPNMQPWDELSADDQNTFARSVDIWVASLGANEVNAEWYERSGQIPRFFWQQVPEGARPDSWGFAALDVLSKLIELAEQAIEIELPAEEEN